MPGAPLPAIVVTSGGAVARAAPAQRMHAQKNRRDLLSTFDQVDALQESLFLPHTPRALGEDYGSKHNR